MRFRLRRARRPSLQVRTPAMLLEVLRDGAIPLAPRPDVRDGRLRLAIVIPQFRRGSGGHHTVADLTRGLEARGHDVSLWLEDEEGRHAGETEAETERLFTEFFGAVRAPVRRRFEDFGGADVALATGWQTVPRVLWLRGVGARGYLVQDHEPEFYGTSAMRLWAQWTYRQGLHCLCASPWLADLIRTQYGATATSFDLGVDHQRYRVLPTRRRDDVVLVYARAVTPRRAVPLALLAMEALARRRPDVAIALFGDSNPVATTFAHRNLGVLDPDALVNAYCSAAVGVVLSLTNPSLVSTEMLACALPVVDVRSASMLATFGADGPIELSELDPFAICAAVEGLLEAPGLRDQRARDGLDFVAGRTWERAAEQVEAGLRQALERSQAGDGAS